MIRDDIVVALLLVAFAGFVTAHVALVAGLLARPPRWKGLVALVVVPLAPVYGARAGMHARWVAWVTFGVAYAVMRVLAR